MRYSYKKALEQLKRYALHEGYKKVVLNHNDVSNITWDGLSLNEPEGIYIEGNHPIEIKTYLFLHELGHHILRRNWDKFKDKFPIQAYAEQVSIRKNDKKYLRRTSYVVSSLEEEFTAWEEGYKLANRLGIKVNKDKWNDLKTRCMRTYINYYATSTK